MNTSTLKAMKAAHRWLLRKGKIPYYAATLSPRMKTDTPEDQSQLVTFDEASDHRCRRRLNIEPPCRSNIEPGRVASF